MSKLEVRLLEPALCHSFPGKPTCLAYDTEGKYIAIGCDNGKVCVLSKSGSGQMKVLSHDHPQPVKLMSFCHEKVNGETFLMTTLEGNPTVFLWSFTDESKCVSQTALGSEITVLTWSSSFSLFYVGTKDGDVLGLTVMVSENDSITFELSNPLQKKEQNDGGVVAVEESKEKALLLIVFSSGLCLVRGDKMPYLLTNDEIPVAAWWKKSEESFSILCKSGHLISINCNSKGKIADPVDVGRDGITKVKHFISTATKELFIAYTGGAPAIVPKEYERSHLITMFHSYENNSDTNALEEFGANVVDFMFLPSEKEQSTKPLLAVLTESELVLMDTSEEGKIRYAMIRYSQSANNYPIMTSSVTSLQLCGECSQEFMVKIKYQTKEGKVPQLLVTGHSDGSVRLWLGYCNDGSLSFELLSHLTVYTERYFKQLGSKSSQSEEPEQNSPGRVSFAKVIDSKYLLVIKGSGRVLLFDNKSEDKPKPKPQSQEIVLKEDSTPSKALETLPPPQFCPHEHEHVQLLQHFSCHYQSGRDQPLVPVTVNCAVYNEQMEMLAVGTTHGLAVIDVKTNMLVQVIGSENKLLKLSLGVDDEIPGCSPKSCDVVCLEGLKVSWKEDEEAQHTLLVGTRGENGIMGSLKITRKGQVLELEATELGKVYKNSALRKIHFYRKEDHKILKGTSDRKTAEFKDEGAEVIIYATAHVAVITDKLLKTYQIPGLVMNSKDFAAGIIWSGLMQDNGKPFIAYVTKDGHKLAGFCLTDFKYTISKNLPVGCHPVKQDIFSSNGKHAIMKFSDQFYYIMDST